MPRNLALSGKNSRKFFDSKGHLRRISGLNYWPLKKVLFEKYHIKEEEAQALADFLIPMLNWNHEDRASAQEMLKHPWLSLSDNYDYKYTEREYETLRLKKQLKEQMKGVAGGAQQDDTTEERQEMNELIQAEQELYAADVDETYIPKTKKKNSERDRLKEEIQNHLNQEGLLSA